ncbi:hypothetical protein SNE35_13805 [Paucibacter sp. R3-3]|uniref:Porin n=1 Tax=Roseateles agri TaxID=3098619 RepID=A0ABU5DIP8_9BURK|nr:hypothetical protein [Paucibacter sp. R3-3]MDY0745590.1 hypothetical protein [Paucibacter sp. R3-3]
MAQDAPAEDAKPTVNFFIGERLWVSTWQESMADAKIVIPNPANPVPVVQSSLATPVSGTTVMPLTVFGLRYGAFTLATTFAPSTGYSSQGLAVGDKIHRKELDVNFAYALSPNFAASLVYKHGTIDQGATAEATALTGLKGSYKLDGLLIGLSASSQLQGPLALYGNLAYGPLRETADLGSSKSKYHGSYRVAELGLAYKLDGEQKMLGLSGLSMQFGYRIQVVDINSIELQTLSTTTPPTLISSQSVRAQSTTQGPVVGLIASF